MVLVKKTSFFCTAIISIVMHGQLADEAYLEIITLICTLKP